MVSKGQKLGHYLILALLLSVVNSCGGYQVRQGRNPLKAYGIRSVAVPMFVNHSVLTNVAGPLTKEVSRVLTQYEGLEVYSGEDARADAILVGVINSKKHRAEVINATAIAFTSGNLQNLIGDRNEFFIGIQTNYEIALQVILIKNPTFEELKFLRTELGQYVRPGPKVIFSERIRMNGSFPRKVFEAPGLTDVNFTYTKGLMESNIQSVAKSTANTFKEVVLNAF